MNNSVKYSYKVTKRDSIKLKKVYVRKEKYKDNYTELNDDKLFST